MWDAATAIRIANVGYVEARAALAAARRHRRVSQRGLISAKAELERRWGEVDVQHVDHDLVRRAGDAAELYSLRALDAIHLAAALALDDQQLVLATWDERLRVAGQAAGLAVAP